jgi:alpha-glucosidase (family GH31 glycosyl hydrolase)
MGNLLGTIRSLDMLGAQTLNCTHNEKIAVHSEGLHCEWGLISRDGWALVDDTDNWALTKGAEWWESPNSDDSDWYLFAHGHDYTKAIADYTLVGGRVPLVPRYALGVWFTQWYDFNNANTKALVYKFRERSLPLDVYVSDMNWHKKDDSGGWTFDPNLYPYPSDTFGWLHSQGLATAANVHDAKGVGNSDKMFPQMCAAMGLDPGRTTHVPFTMSNKTYAYAVEDVVLKDVADEIDFTWINWQQGGQTGGMAGGKQNPTMMLNKLRVTSPKRQKGAEDQTRKRGMVLSRWGGLGSHRYPVGFSGDVALPGELPLSWEKLAYQPYFSLTAANVAYGYWSHDVQGPLESPEMYVRWVQWAAYSGVFRLHDRGMSADDCSRDVLEKVKPGSRVDILREETSLPDHLGVPSKKSNESEVPLCSNVRPWEIGPTRVSEQFYASIRSAMVARAELVPYLYTAAREAFAKGLGLLRPMYYEYPEQEEAYWASPNGSFAQYMLGPDLLVSPVTAPREKETNLATRAVWLPPGGSWYEMGTGALLEGGQVLVKGYDLSETPLFVRAGAVVPSMTVGYGEPHGKAVASPYQQLTFSVYPGATNGTGSCYEDDGLTEAYLAGEVAITKLSYTRNATSMQLTISRQGTFQQIEDKSRIYHIIVVSGLPPNKISLSIAKGEPAKVLPRRGPAHEGAQWWYDGPTATLHVLTAPIDISEGSFALELQTQPVDDRLLSGLKGIFAHSNLAKDNLDQARVVPTPSDDEHRGALSRLSSVGDSLTYLSSTNKDNFMEALRSYRDQLEAAVDELGALRSLRADYSRALLETALN